MHKFTTILGEHSVTVDFPGMGQTAAVRAFMDGLPGAQIHNSVVPHSAISFSGSGSCFEFTFKNVEMIPPQGPILIPRREGYRHYSLGFSDVKILLRVVDAAHRLQRKVYLSLSEKLSMDDLNKLYEYLGQDFPEVWWIYGLSSSSVSGNVLEINLDMKYTDAQILQYQKQIDAKLSEIMAQPGLDQMFDIQKEYFIQSVISKITKYNLKPADPVKFQNIRKILGVFVTGECVCAGMAYAFKFLCDIMKIKSIVVYGFGKTEAHAWNMIQLNNTWYYVDPTWNHDTHPYGGYFNIDQKTIEKDHTIDDLPLLPKAESMRHNLFDCQGLRIGSDVQGDFTKVIKAKLAEYQGPVKLGLLLPEKTNIFELLKHCEIELKTNLKADDVQSYSTGLTTFTLVIEDEKLIFGFPDENAVVGQKFMVEMDVAEMEQRMDQLPFGYGYSYSGKFITIEIR